MVSDAALLLAVTVPTKSKMAPVPPPPHPPPPEKPRILQNPPRNCSIDTTESAANTRGTCRPPKKRSFQPPALPMNSTARSKKKKLSKSEVWPPPPPMPPSPPSAEDAAAVALASLSSPRGLELGAAQKKAHKSAPPKSTPSFFNEITSSTCSYHSLRVKAVTPGTFKTVSDKSNVRTNIEESEDESGDRLSVEDEDGGVIPGVNSITSKQQGGAAVAGVLARIGYMMVDHSYTDFSIVEDETLIEMEQEEKTLAEEEREGRRKSSGIQPRLPKRKRQKLPCEYNKTRPCLSAPEEEERGQTIKRLQEILRGPLRRNSGGVVQPFPDRVSDYLVSSLNFLLLC